MALERHLSQIRIPGDHVPVYKEECAFTFDTPYSPTGLYTNLATFRAVGADLLHLDAARSECCVYLHQLWRRVPKETEPVAADAAAAAPTKLAIGVEGGFAFDGVSYEIERTYQIVVVEGEERFVYPYPDANLPTIVQLAVTAVLAQDDASKETEFKAWEDEYVVTKYADGLIQLDNGVRVSPNPADWKCEHCGVRDNLWLNLSDGYIGGGRQMFDGSGGCGAALQHFQDTGGIFPLCVKLGTITPDGADVFSYADDESDMVIDPKLSEHLAHWGINMMAMKKTAKTMAELNVAFNASFEWSAITESGTNLVPLTGPGHVGLRNLGNTCYINSLLQLFFALPEFHEQFFREPTDLYLNAPQDPASDLVTQLCKLAYGLGSTKYADGTSEISPKMLKTIVGRNHPEFSSIRQQDIHEYYQHFLKCMSRAARAQGINDLSQLFTFDQEVRLECLQSHRVRYTTVSGENTLALAVSAEDAINQEEVAASQERADSGSLLPQVLPIIPFERLLEKFAASEIIDHFMSPVTQQLGDASKSTRFATFPRYLVVQIRRYVLASDWTPKKINAIVPVPERLDLSSLRKTGLKPGEVAMAEAGSIEPDAAIVAQIRAMDFSENAAKRAAIATKNANAEAALEWIFAHMEDPDLNTPLASSAPAAAAPAGGHVDPEALQSMLAFGISESHARRALLATDGNLERAADWAFNHEEEPEDTGAPPAAMAVDDNASGVYELVGFASHMGPNTDSGHYVCHIKKNGAWVIFNDEKVALSENPPLGLGYLYLFRRV